MSQKRQKRPPGSTGERFGQGADAFPAIGAEPVEPIGKRLLPFDFVERAQRPAHEVKLKYLADNQFRLTLSGSELKQAVSEYIRNKKADLKGTMETQGTTPAA